MKTSATSAQRAAPSDDADDLVWGAEAIGRVINRTAAQVLHLIETGVLDGAVMRVGHRTYCGSQRRIRDKFPQ
jgi:hypothetical protein